MTLVMIAPFPASAADSPFATISTPSEGSWVPLNEPLIVAGGAVDGEAGGITHVEVSTDGGANWTIIDARTERWQFVIVPTVAGPLTIIARARTASTVGPVTATRTISVDGSETPELPGDGTHTLFLPEQAVVADPDRNPVEVGVRTRFDRDGFVTGMVLRRGAYTGPVTARVWADGRMVASQEVPEGATRVTFESPVGVSGGREYVVSYFTPVGGYVVTERYFSGGIAQAPFYVPFEGGVYAYGGGVPDETWNAANYWVRPIFQA